jgi:O-antigen ligase
VTTAVVSAAPALPSAGAVPRRLWFCWVSLCVLTLLNANSIADLAGAPPRVFNPLLLLVALGVLSMVLGEARKLGRPPLPAVFVFITVFLLEGTFAAVLSREVPLDQALERIPGYLAAVLLLSTAVLMSMRATEEQQINLLLKTLFWPLVAASLSGVLFFALPFIGDYLTLQPGARLHGVFGNVNELGSQAGYALVVGLVLSMRTGQRRWLIIGGGAGVIGAVSSFSKAAMLDLVPLIGLLGYAGAGARVTWKSILGLLFALGLAVLGFLFAAKLLLEGSLGITLDTDVTLRLGAIMDLLSRGTIDESTSTGRTGVWLTGLQAWLDAPILGLGLSAFDRVRGIDTEIHSTVLRVLGESGLIGMIAFLVMGASVVLSTLRATRRDLQVLGFGFIIVQLPAVIASGGILLERNHNIVTGCVIGLLAAGWAPGPGPTSPSTVPAV